MLLKKDNMEIPVKLIYKGEKFNWLLYLILKYPNKNWNWEGLSNNPNITWETIYNDPNQPWDWFVLSKKEYLRKNN